MRRRVVADHVGRVSCILDAQSDAQIGVGANVLVEHAARSLRREQKVDAEAASPLGDTKESADEVRLLDDQRCEFIDHDDEPGQHVHSPVSIHRPAVLAEVVRPDRPQEHLTAAEFGLQAAQRPGRESVVEVGHQTNGVREGSTRIERRTALVVDQHERDRLRTGASRKTEHQAT